MDTPFPFGLPLPTAFYLTIYLSTLMIHIVFMNYVLAGSAYLVSANIFQHQLPTKNPIYSILSDWMPFMLSAAITAGIAPLLFLQILYREQFYTANLLLFYRWMAILPVLILGFYLAYLLQAKFAREWPKWGRVAIAFGVFACLGFVGWSWVENHLLSVQSKDVWAEQYAFGSLIYRTPELIPRLILWFVAAFPTMALVVAWQIWTQNKDQHLNGFQPISGSKRLAAIALAGIVVSTISATIYFAAMSQTARETIFGPVARPYLVLAIIGGAIQTIAWLPQFRAGITRMWLVVATVGLVVNFVGMAVVNEATRLASLDITLLYERHNKSWQVSGLACFLFFLVLNCGLMTYCVRLVRRNCSEAS